MLDFKKIKENLKQKLKDPFIQLSSDQEYREKVFSILKELKVKFASLASQDPKQNKILGNVDKIINNRKTIFKMSRDDSNIWKNFALNFSKKLKTYYQEIFRNLIEKKIIEVDNKNKLIKNLRKFPEHIENNIISRISEYQKSFCQLLSMYINLSVFIGDKRFEDMISSLDEMLNRQIPDLENIMKNYNFGDKDLRDFNTYLSKLSNLLVNGNTIDKILENINKKRENNESLISRLLSRDKDLQESADIVINGFTDREKFKEICSSPDKLFNLVKETCAFLNYNDGKGLKSWFKEYCESLRDNISNIVSEIDNVKDSISEKISRTLLREKVAEDHKNHLEELKGELEKDRERIKEIRDSDSYFKEMLNTNEPTKVERELLEKEKKIKEKALKEFGDRLRSLLKDCVDELRKINSNFYKVIKIEDQIFRSLNKIKNILSKDSVNKNVIKGLMSALKTLESILNDIFKGLWDRYYVKEGDLYKLIERINGEIVEKIMCKRERTEKIKELRDICDNIEKKLLKLSRKIAERENLVEISKEALGIEEDFKRNLLGKLKDYLLKELIDRVVDYEKRALKDKLKKLSGRDLLSLSLGVLLRKLMIRELRKYVEEKDEFYEEEIIPENDKRIFDVLRKTFEKYIGFNIEEIAERDSISIKIEIGELIDKLLEVQRSQR